MFKIVVSVFLLFSIQKNTCSQSTNPADDLALKIPQTGTRSVAGISNYIKENFSTDSARIRAIYVWITHHISYDFARVKTRNIKMNEAPQTVEDVLKTRAAVCHGYASLFVDLCNSMGIKAIFIGGYGKAGGMLGGLPHAWAAAEVKGSWYLFDPTWGAGYIRNEQFVWAFNNSFYMVPPDKMIKDHMPFDPMHQFLNHIVSNKEFLDGQTAINTSKPYFNYADTIRQHALLSAADKAAAEARRLEANGIPNPLLRDRLNHLRTEMGAYAGMNKFEESGKAFKQSMALLNEYINLKNKQFAAIEDSKLRQMTDSMSYYATQARTLLFSIVPRDESHRQNLAGNHQALEKLQKRIMEEKDFVAKYLASDKASRMQLFTRK